jgi:hypothetical protein
MTDNHAPQENETPSIAEPGKGRLAALLPTAAGALLGLVIIAIIIGLAVRALVSRGPSGIPLQVTRVSDTSPLAPPLSPLVVEIGDAEITLSTPVRLELSDGSFPVIATSGSDDDIWATTQRQPGSAAWVYGTVINYVIGLEPNSDNRELMEDLRPGDEVTLRLASGTLLSFRAREMLELSLDDPTITEQARPGLTIVLLSDDAETIVATASFDSATEPAVGGDTNAELGQAVQVGVARVTVTNGHSEHMGGDQPPGTTTFVVEFALANTGSVPMNPAEFLMDLRDSLGNRYLPSPAASAEGVHGPISSPIQPGGERSGSAGYIIPDTTTGPNLSWVFSPNPASRVRAIIEVPYSPVTHDDVLPEVEVLEAFLSESQTLLHIVAEIYNPGDNTLTVTADDISLSSSAGPGDLLISAPPFPWVINGGRTREVELQFASPSASTAAITILDYTFEISGLP